MREIIPVPGYTGGQYSLFRILFGVYLAVHFGHLSLYAAELFSLSGMLSEGRHSPLLAFAPSLLRFSDTPLITVLITLSGFLAAVAFAAGRFDRLSAAWMLVVLISLFARNPLIANPALPYVGLMLFAHLCLPPAPFGSLAARGRTDPAGNWVMPRPVFVALTMVLCLSYSYSGYTKLLSPNWVSGDAVALVLQNPLARDWILRDALLALPEWVTAVMTGFILYVELLFAPLFLFKSLRVWLWSAMLIVQFGFLLLLSFPDLTIPMLLFHLLLFDPAWLPPRPLNRAILHYDGECGICHAAVRFALAETPRTGAALAFRPMQLDVSDVKNAGSWCLVDEAGNRFEKTSAMVRLLEAGGGVWRLCAAGVRLTPGFFRDGAYNALARFRRHLAVKPPELCPVVSGQLAGRFRTGPEKNGRRQQSRTCPDAR